MQISMVGIDHNKASIELREQFSFTKAQAAEAMWQIRKEGKADGCLLISTCNRTELYVSGWGNQESTPYEVLCERKNIDPKRYSASFTQREGNEAVDHLFRLSCGLHSRIFGEDQIITQVREALTAARRCGCEDAVIEKLFQTAIAAAKKVKSSVRLTKADPSTASNAIAFLQEHLGSLKDVPCLVIGNGQMGLLVANALTARGAQVAMTLRKKYHGSDQQESIVPAGCTMVPYEERLSVIGDYKVIVSATLSPHYTILDSDLEDVELRKDCIMLDLAVPRDIDPQIGESGKALVCDIDQLGAAVKSQADQKAMKQALAILKEYSWEMERWLAFREMVPQVQEIAALTGRDTVSRLAEPLGEAVGTGPERERLSDAISQATEKAVGKLLYNLRETLPPQLWQGCIDALEQGARRDTLKTGEAKKLYEVIIE